MARRTITVSLPDRKLIVQDETGSVIRQYSVYVGSKLYPTRTGRFTIHDDTEIAGSDPTYNGVFLAFHEYPDLHPNGEIDGIAVAGFHGWKYGPEDDEEELKNPGWKTSTEGCVQLTDEDMADFLTVAKLGDEVIVLDVAIADIEHLQTTSRERTAV